ncbi:MAG TPA: LssY C-terminal domain-containing protein, partial [Verrucomicrobiae bacterium]|nr:LssY C-terminal domain-containing protein [Verrucomicrobiae bacterium]
FVDRRLRLPDIISWLITYVVAAYVLVPALIRFIRIVRPPKHVPLYCVTPDGFASDPINIGIIATRRELLMAMERAGWYIADPHTPRYLGRQILSTIFGWSYSNAPVSSLYLFGRKQDIAFEIPLGAGSAGRHHVRFWATTYEGGKKSMSFRSIHWHHRRAHVFGDNLLWVGASSLDVGVSVIRHNFQFTHMIDPDTNLERDLIVEQLRSQKLVKKVETIKLGDPYRLINRVWRGSLHTDGKMAVVTLRKKV